MKTNKFVYFFFHFLVKMQYYIYDMTIDKSHVYVTDANLNNIVYFLKKTTCNQIQTSWCFRLIIKVARWTDKISWFHQRFLLYKWMNLCNNVDLRNDRIPSFRQGMLWNRDNRSSIPMQIHMWECIWVCVLGQLSSHTKCLPPSCTQHPHLLHQQFCLMIISLSQLIFLTLLL